MESLLRELVLNVLLRLPVKDLMRCKCVCKFWFDIINDPHFISNYYIFFNRQEEKLLVLRTPNYSLGCEETEISIVSWNPNEPRGLVSSRFIDHPFQDIDIEFSSNFKISFGFWTDIMGPCNGIYFLKGSPNVIMNPSLSQFKALPQSHLAAPHGTYTKDNPFTEIPRFGFDPKTNDYKVVVLKRLYSEETHIPLERDWAIELYSLNSNSWTNLGVDVIPFPFEAFDLEHIFPYVNNCCHWVGAVHKSDEDEDKYDIVVLSFDMVNELFRKIKVPETMPPFKHVFIRNLIPCHESTTIGFLDHYHVDQGTEELFCFDVWILKDYWDEESWVKQYSVGPMQVIYHNLVGYYGSNQSLWQDTNQKLVLYELDCEEHKDLVACRDQDITCVVQYKESLVSLQRRVEF